MKPTVLACKFCFLLDLFIFSSSSSIFFLFFFFLDFDLFLQKYRQSGGRIHLITIVPSLTMPEEQNKLSHRAKRGSRFSVPSYIMLCDSDVPVCCRRIVLLSLV